MSTETATPADDVDEGRRWAHVVCPEPGEENTDHLAWARYHLARADAWWKAVWTLDYDKHDEWTDRALYANINGLADARLGLLYLHGNSPEGIRLVIDQIGDGDSIGEWVYEHLRNLGVDPDSIRPYGTRRVLPEPYRGRRVKASVDPTGAWDVWEYKREGLTTEERLVGRYLDPDEAQRACRLP